MTSKIQIITCSKALNQDDAIEGRNRKLNYYDTQLGALIDHLHLRYPNVHIKLIGLNSMFKFDSKSSDSNYAVVRLPYVENVLLNVILFNISDVLYSLLKDRPSLMLIYSDGESYPYLGTLLLSKLFRVPIFLCIRNPPQFLYPMEEYSFPRKTITKYLDYLFLKWSEKIVHISTKSRDLLKIYPDLYHKSIVMASAPGIKPIKIQKTKKEESYITFAYWGVMDKTRKLDIVIEGFNRAKMIDDKFNGKFYLFGDGNDFERLMLIVKELRNEDIIFKGYIHQEKLFEFLANSSAAIIPIPPDDFFQYSSPLKLAEAIALELPIIANDIEPNKIVRERELGILCEHSVEGYAKAFTSFWSLSDSEKNYFRYNCRQIKHIYSRTNIFKELDDSLMEDILTAY